MPITAARVYLQRIADWQAETGCTGAPPVAFDKKLSNWVQYCRTVGRRGRLNKEISDAFGTLGIALDRGPLRIELRAHDLRGDHFRWIELRQ